jgi:hypothetical protein
MDPYAKLQRLKDQIRQDYLASPTSEIVYVIHAQIRSKQVLDEPAHSKREARREMKRDAGREERPCLVDTQPPDPLPIMFDYRPPEPPLEEPESDSVGPRRPLRGSNPHDSIDPARGWTQLGKRLGFERINLIWIGLGDSAEFLISPISDRVASRRFRTQLLDLGRLLEYNETTGWSQFLLPSRLFQYLLFAAPRDEEAFHLRASTFYLSPSRGAKLRESKYRFSEDFLVPQIEGDGPRPAGDYFFVLQGDAVVS